MSENIPLLDRSLLEEQFGNYQPGSEPALPNIPYRGLQSPSPSQLSGEPSFSALEALEASIFRKSPDDRLRGGGIPRTLSEVSSERYNEFVPGTYNNEDAYAQGQGWASKMVSGVGKGLLLTGTTFLQSTAGMVNGIAQAISDGRAASFYDNDMNRFLDELNKKAENVLPNYYKDTEKNAHWYSPSKLFTANFLWDGIIKNMGFSAGAALSGGVYASGLKALSSLPLLSRLFSVGKAAEALAATEEGILSAENAYGKIRSLSDRFLYSYNALNKGQRILVAGLATTGEASFEAYQNLNQFRNEKIAQYKELHGYEPRGEELEQINREADSVGNYSFLLNTALLSATNYIQFPKILGSSYTVEKGMINSLQKETGEIVKEGEKYIAAPVKNRLLHTLNNIRPYTFSSSEAFEEGAQYAIQTGTQDYYDKKYKGESPDFLSSLSQGITKTLSTDEGMENVLIGGLSGAWMQGVGRYKQNNQKEKNTQEALTAFNKSSVSEFASSTLDAVKRGTLLQEEREEALKRGDILESKDKEADYIINYLSPRIKYGRMDLVKSDLAEYRTLASTEEGFAQLQEEGKALPSDTREAYLNRLSALEQTAENVKSLYQSLHLRYGSRVDEKGNLLYTSEVMDKMVYAASKVADYDKRIPSLSSSLLLKGISTQEVSSDILEGNSDAYDKAHMQIEALDINADEKETLHQALDDFAELTLRRKHYLTEYAEIKNNPSKFHEQKEENIPDNPEEEKKIIKLKTKDGEEDVEIGTEYFLGRVTEHDKNGHEVYRAPRLTILGENEDGTIKIKDSEGKIKDIEKSVLQDYKLGKVSDTLNNKKAKFFKEHWNTVFEHFGLKDKKGNPRKGRLEYSTREGELTFVYRDDKGNIKRVPVKNRQFAVQKGFEHAMLRPVGTLTAVQKSSMEELSGEKEDEKTIKAVERRRAILTNLYMEVAEKQEKTEKLIAQKQAELSNIQKEIASLEQIIEKGETDSRIKKGFNFKSSVRKALSAAVRLSKMQHQVEEEIEQLTSQKQETESILSYIEDASQNIEELPTGGKEFLQELRDQVSLLEDNILDTGMQINALSKLIDSINKAIDSAISLLSELVSEFRQKYPKVPLAWGQEWIDFLKENPNFLKLKPSFKEDLSTLEEIVAQTEDFEITPNQEKVKDLRIQLSALQESLKDTGKELQAKQIILERFEQVAREYKKQKEEEALLEKSQELKEKLIGTHDKAIQNVTEGTYEVSSKKSKFNVVGSTITSENADQRSNRYGFRFPEGKGVIVTSKTEDQLGLSGLTKKIFDSIKDNDGKYKKEEIIVLVLTDEKGTPVDEFNNPITENSLDKAVFQVFPMETLKASYMDSEGNRQYGSMFREGTPEHEIAQLTQQYAQWRASQLASTTVEKPREVKASFGIAQLVTYTDENGKEKRDHNARTSAEEAGLADPSKLKTEQSIKVATSDEIAEEEAVFKNVKGRVFLKTKGGLAKLFNRKISRKESENIFQAMHLWAKNIAEGKNFEESKPLYEWLKSVVYWGIAKNQKGERKPAGYNNIWFESVKENGKDVTRLFISGKTKESPFQFTPSSLEQNKELIINLLQELHNNCSATLVNEKAWNVPYYEITGFEKGNPVTRKWPNYQSYLLSENYYDEDGKILGKRPKEEIPFVTQFKPLKDKEDTNRKGIYFTLTSTPLDYHLTAPEEKKEAPKQEAPKETSKEEKKEQKEQPKQPKQPAAPQTFKLDGEEEIISFASGDVTFSLDAQKAAALAHSLNLDLSQKENRAIFLDALIREKLFSFTIPGEVRKKVMLANSIDDKTATDTLLYNVVNRLLPQITAVRIPAASVVKDEPKGVPVENTEVLSSRLNRPRTTEKQDTSAFRLANNINFQGEEWQKVEAWMKKNFPHIPVYRVKNVIQATNGRQAWGMLQDAAIYLSQNAEVGTAYHEVFEAVWKLFAGQEEKQSILDEFRARKSSFINRFTGETISYQDASNSDIKEELAEEFRDYILYGTKPQQTQKSFIRKLFEDIVSFFREFFTGKKAQSNTEALFEKIGNGFYAKYNPFETRLSVASKGIIDIDSVSVNGGELRLETLPALQSHEVIQHMLFTTLRKITRDNESLFEIEKLKRSDIYDTVKKEVLLAIGSRLDALESLVEKKLKTAKEVSYDYNSLEDLYENVGKSWGEITRKFEEKLRTYGVEFDENDEITLNDENASGKGDWQDARKIDSFRKANSAVRLLIGTLPYCEIRNGEISWKPSTIGGATLMPSDQVFVRLQDKLHDAISIEEMLSRLEEMAGNDINYITLYKRLTKSLPGKAVDFSSFKKHDLMLLSSFWKSMKKQNADVAIVFVLPSGEVVISDSALGSMAKQAKKEMIGSVIDKIKTGSKYFSYDKKKGTYNPTSLVKNYSLDASNIQSYVSFLKEIGIEFTHNDLTRLSKKQLTLFRDAVKGIKESLSSIEDVEILSTSTLDIDKRLSQLGAISATLTSPDIESTYFNINGERTQTFVGTNAPSMFYDTLSKAKNIEDLRGTPYEYLLTDSFSKGSVLLQSIFDTGKENQADESFSGKRRENTENIMHPVFVDGLADEKTGKKKESSRLTSRERLILELNLNSEGIYLNLVPGDASIEHALRMHEEQSPFVTDQSYAAGDYLRIFRDYFISEVELSRENRNVHDSKELRFFKSILGEEYSSVMKGNEKLSPEELYNKHKAKIDKCVRQFTEQEASDTSEMLKSFGVIEYTEEGMQAEGLLFAENTTLDEQVLQGKLCTLSVNYIIANIELHKLLYGDPYKYSDELKRIKNFCSPRQPLMEMGDDLRNAFNREFNQDGEGKLGYTDFRGYMKAVTIDDVISSLDEYGEWEETDGGGYITLKAYRLFKILSGDWTSENEKQFIHDTQYENLVRRIDMSKDAAEKEELRNHLETLEKDNPGVKSTYTPIKPIVSGSNQNGREYNDSVLHKFALMPLSFRVLHKMGAVNALKFYTKMIKEDVDYAVYRTGEKVGTEHSHPLYNEDGTFNTAPFALNQDNPSLPQGISLIPHSIMGVQAEVPSKDSPLTTQGSQMTKLVTMDLMDAGVPADFEPSLPIDQRIKKWEASDKTSPLYSEIQKNQKLLETQIELGFATLLKKLGIEKTSGGFRITDREKLVSTLRDEIEKREVNDNIIESLDGYVSGDTILEATPSYRQIRNILLSIADKNVVSRKMNGGMKVQVPSTLLEKNRVKISEITDKKGNKKPVYSSDILKFYTKEEPWCEIMIGRWFDSSLSDEELLNFLNNTEEGQKMLSGVAFRIPTQRQNSIERFKIAKFLPKEFGDSVVIPSALVKKVGSDFDIDKLSIYLKNIIKGLNGKPELVKLFNDEKETKEYYDRFYEEKLEKQIERLQEKTQMLSSILSKLPLGSPKTTLSHEEYTYYSENIDGIYLIMSQAEEAEVPADEYIQMKGWQKEASLGNKLLNESLKKEFVDSMYKKAVDNEYISSLEALVSHPLNYENLLRPNSADQLKEITTEVDSRLGREKRDYSSTGNMLSRRFMSGLRQNFVMGKRAIGIAAVGQTNNAQNQRAKIYVNTDKIASLDEKEKAILGGFTDSSIFASNPGINFEHYNTIVIEGKKYPTLSVSKNSKGQYISDVMSQFIDGFVDISKDDWIMRLGVTPNVASTWMFLVKIGVPVRTVAGFMNQPIIRDYLQSIENAGYSYLFGQKNMENILDFYRTEDTSPIQKIPSETALFKTMGKKDLSPKEKAEQQFMLKEFVKYAKMAEHLFQVTQGSNFDTANMNDPFIIFKKQKQLEKARKTIISSVDEMMEKSFIGTLRERITDIRNAFSEILLSDKPNVRNVLEAVLTPYINLSDREFVKVAQKAVNDLFDWAMQNKRGINTRIAEILLGSDSQKSASEQIMDFVEEVKRDKNHPLHQDEKLTRNIVLNSLRRQPGEKAGKANNLYLSGRDNKVYDQDLLIQGFRELKKYASKDIYGKIVRLSLLQSGLSVSPISFTSLLPYEDFKEVYNEVLSSLEDNPSLRSFYDLRVFERNNYYNSDIIPFKRAKLIKTKRTDIYTGAPIWFNPDEAIDKNLKKASSMLPKIIGLDIHSRESQNEFVVYSWQDRISASEVIKRRKTGNRSHIHKALMQRVRDEEGNPVVSESKGKYYKYLYKAVNTWGDSYRAQELYDSQRPSVFDNGYMKVQKKFDEEGNQTSSDEVEDSEIMRVIKEGTISPKMAMRNDNIQKIKEGKKTMTARTYKMDEGNYTLPDGTVIHVTPVGEIHSKNLENLNKLAYELGTVNQTRPQEMSRENILNEWAKAEGYSSLEDIRKNTKFQHIREFIEGNRSLWIYNIEIVSSNTKTIVTSEADMAELEEMAALAGVSDKKINIYAGTNENAHLSNFAIRPFTINYKDGSVVNFKSVEQAYQYTKVSEYAKTSSPNNNVMEEILETTNGAKLRYLGSAKAVEGLNVAKWDNDSSLVMKRLLRESFKQNPEALKKLLATGNAQLTHTQDTSKWKTEFPRLLMEIRNEFKIPVLSTKDFKC